MYPSNLWDDCESVGFLFDVHQLQYFERDAYTRPVYVRHDGAVAGRAHAFHNRPPLSQQQQDDRFNGRYLPPSLADLDF